MKFNVVKNKWIFIQIIANKRWDLVQETINFDHTFLKKKKKFELNK